MKALVKALALSAAVAAGSAGAATVNVGGVVWEPGSFFDFTTTDTMYEQVVTNIGDVATGYGKILSLNAAGENAFCPGCELTYKFTGFVLADNAGSFTFTGGTLEVYVDSSPDWNPLDPSKATDGVLWLSLAAHTTYDSGTGKTGTLHSDATPAGPGIKGDGNGFFDVVGGLAAAYFDTDFFTVDEDAVGTTGKADFQFTSSYQLLPQGPIIVPLPGGGFDVYPLFGSNDLQGRSRNVVPEPGSLALVSLGLLGAVGVLRRRRK